MHDLQLMSAAHQQVPQAAVDEGHMWHVVALLLVLIASIALICKSLWTKASAK